MLIGHLRVRVHTQTEARRARMQVESNRVLFHVLSVG